MINFVGEKYLLSMWVGSDRINFQANYILMPIESSNCVITHTYF